MREDKGTADMNGISNRTLAGISVPDTALVDRAIEYARQKCEPYLFNHVVRSWLFATRIGQIQNIEHDAEIVAVGTLLHDITLNENFSGPRRFEVEGADLARAFARELGLDERRAQLIWDSVALNSTASIGLYKEPEVALCTAGVCLDVVGLQYSLIQSAEMTRIVEAFPRLGMKQHMTQCFCHIAKVRPETTYDNFARDFGERFVPGYKAPSAVDFVMNAPFEE
jgi:HD domain